MTTKVKHESVGFTTCSCGKTFARVKDKWRHIQMVGRNTQQEHKAFWK